MFGKKRKIEEQIKKLEMEKLELLRIKNILEEDTPKIDISNVFVFSLDGKHSFVRMEIKNIVGYSDFYKTDVKGFESILIDIFSNYVIYKKNSMDLIKRKEYINKDSGYYNSDSFAYIRPICDVEPNLLAYVDKKVPLYVLQQLFYKLNDVDLFASILMKRPKK